MFQTLKILLKGAVRGEGETTMSHSNKSMVAVLSIALVLLGGCQSNPETVRTAGTIGGAVAGGLIGS
jgi:hypothetical protein